MKQLLLLVILAFGIQNLSAQPWLKHLPQSKASYSFYDYQTAFNTYWAPKNVKNGKYIKDGVSTKAIGWKQFKRWEYFNEDQINPDNGNFPTQTAIEIYNTAKQNGQIQSLIGNTNTWTSLGTNSSSGGYSGIGRVSCIAFHPTDNNTYWVGAPAGGLWKTTDNGGAWTCLTDSNNLLGISSIIIPTDYATSNTIYIGTGDRDGWDNRSIGVLKSTDGGATWNTTGLNYNLNQNRMINKMLIDPNNNSIILAATNNGLQKTTDGGATWTQLSSTTFIDLEFKPGTFSTLYGSTTNGKIYLSTNSGATWAVKHNSGSRVELAVSPANSNYVYAIIANSSNGLHGIFKSTDSGNTFTNVYNSSSLMNWKSDGSGTNDGQGWYDLSLAVSPTDINKVIMGGVISHRSTNGGTSWSCSNCWTGSSYYNLGNHPVVHADKHNLVYRSNGDLFECNDGGVYLSTNNGSTWSDKSDGLVISQMYKLGVSQTVATETITGLQDNGTKLLSGGVWDDVKGGDGMECLIDYTDVNIQYGTYTNGQISRTTNHWSNSTDIEPSAAGSGAWVTPYIIDPVNHSTLYAGYADIWKTTDKGNNWTKISNLNVASKFKSMAISSSNNSVLYVASSSNIWKTLNGGTTWTNVTSNLPSNSSIKYITIKNNDPNTVWVSLSGYNNDNVYTTTDGGATWTNMSTGLPAIPAYSLVQDTSSISDITLYVGTELGIYIKVGADNWAEYNLNMPKVKVGELEIYYNINPGNNKLRAATYGRGLWEVDLYSLNGLQLTANFDADSKIICTNDTINFTDASFGSPTSWAWTFSPNTISYASGSTNSSQSPSVIFNNSGQYSVSLTVTNANGSDTKTINNYVSIGGYALPFIEDFEANSTTLSAWRINNPDASSITWALTPTSGNGSSTRSIFMNNYNYSNTSHKDYLIAPVVNLSNLTTAALKFKHAYTRYNASYGSDSLLIMVSTDCGATFTTIDTLTEDGTGNFATAPDNTFASTTNFIPATASDWCGSAIGADCDSINLNAYVGNDNVMIAFQGINSYSNNLYIDDVEITGENTTNVVADFTGPTVICSGVSTVFTNASVNATSYIWKQDNIVISTAQNLTKTFTTSGNIEIRLIVTDGTDTDSMSLLVTVTEGPTQANTPTGAATSCTNINNEIYTTTGALNANSYIWTLLPSNAGVITGSGLNASVNWDNSFVGNATISVKAVGTCSIGAESTPFQVSISEAPGYAATPQAPSSLCADADNTNVSCSVISNANSYSWSLIPTNAGVITGNTLNANIDWNASYVGLAKLYVAGNNICGDGALSSPKNINVRSNPSTPTVTQNIEILTSSSNSNNQWYNSTNMISGANQQTYTPTANGSYAVEVHNNYGCKSKSNFITITNVSINTSLVDNEVKVFPNPAKDYIIIEYAGNENIVLNLRNSLSENILSTEFINTTKLDLSNISSGVYFIEMHIKGQAETTVVKKIVITNK